MTTARIAINGFGRIGRLVFRILSSRKFCSVIAINDVTDAPVLAHLLKYDSVHEKYPGTVKAENNSLIVDGQTIKICSERDPAKLPWKDIGIDIVIESTGKFTDSAGAGKHLEAGAKKVIISAPSKGKDIKQIVIGVNEFTLSQNDKIISNASCTTNCAAPMIKILDDHWGIEQAFVGTIHAFTSDQRLHDAPHKDLRRARAATLSIIPTTTGAAKAITVILPHLEGKLKGDSYRVPVSDGSVVDMVCLLKKHASVAEINKEFKIASESAMKGIIEYSEEPLVSADIIGNPHSCVFDSLLTTSLGNLVKVAGWYDNEYGYSTRIVDLAEIISKE